MGVLSDPPEGLIVHTHFVEGNRVRIVDVWDSREAFETFRDGRLMPTMEMVAADSGMDMSQAAPPETTMTEVAGLVRGR
jgi:heme-degrading monooxygenase HmoA